MKVASRVFAIIGLVCSIIIIIIGFVMMGALKGQSGAQGILGFYFGYGIYALIVSIGCLCSINGSSKGAVIAWGIFNIPVMLIGSIFMFCIKPEDLY